MITFEYEARDTLGHDHHGELQAESKSDADQQLRKQGLQVKELKEADDELTIFSRRIKRTDIIYLTSQLAIMVDTGISISKALDGIADQEDNPRLRRVLEDLKSRVERGEDFSVALSQYPKLFNKTYVSLIRASEQTGSLGEMLERVATYLRKEADTRGKVRAAMAYPCVMLVLAVSVTVFLLTFVLPKFAPLFARKGTDLPKPTIIMMAASESLLEYWYAWLIGTAVVVITFLIGRRTEFGRRVIDWAKLNTPILGPLFRKVAISRSIRTLGTMIHSGVSMLDSLKVASEVSGNYFYERAWINAIDEVTQGSRVGQTLSDDPLFPKTLIQMIGSGEETGKLDQVLEKVSVHYDMEVENSLKVATSLIEPIMITAMGVVVGGIGLSLLLPIFSLSRGG